MKNIKFLKVVLTFVISLTITLEYMANAKLLNNISKNSSMMISENKSVIKNITEVTAARLAKDNQNSNNKNVITSRSGKHEPLTTTQNINSTNTTSTEPANSTEESIAEPVEEIAPEKPTYQGVELEYSATYHVTSNRLNKSKGVVYYNGHKETYYSQKVLSGKGLKMLNNNGRHVANDGTIRDGEGYIAVACNYLSKGSKIMTSLGPGKVYDTGGMTGKWIDIYVNW